MRRKDELALFELSLLILFLELALIRWVPAHVLYLTFFTNVVLLASFLGLSLGLLRASSPQDLAAWTPALLALTMACAHGVEWLRPVLERVVSVNPGAPELVFFGTDAAAALSVRVPVEALAGLFFVLVALVFVGPGQELGRSFARLGGGARAYAVNVGGSLLGVGLFGAASKLELSPPWWFALCAVLLERRRGLRPARLACWAVVAWAALRTVGPFTVPLPTGPVAGERLWSPYYRIDYLEPPVRDIRANLIGHQRMWGKGDPYVAYALPHLLRRDSGGAPFADALIIGAGSGNDAARALEWGARHVDAVEIDPAMVRLGARDHPDRPYADPRVSVHIGDGRAYLRTCEKRYDLVVYALIDSLILHSGYSSIRLESYLYTREALSDARRLLKPGGVLVVSNYFREGWIVGRLHAALESAFGRPPLTLTYPYSATVGPDTRGGFTVLLAGDTEGLSRAFARHPEYRLPAKAAPSPVWPDGFRARAGLAFPLSAVATGPDAAVTDDWPFLYLRRPGIPDVSRRGIAMMALLSAALLAAFWPRRGRGLSLDRRMFFLGAGFMLVEAKAVTGLALLFGGTWTVNCFVFAGILLCVLAANLWTLKARPRLLWPYYAGVFLFLGAAYLVPAGSLLAWAPAARLAAAGFLSFAPAFFAGVVFSALFERSRTPAEAVGANTSGAMLGGLAEYSSMVWGFKALCLVAALFYALSLDKTPKARLE
ncbi:MAG: methyltransferase domain-containing protein [Elusimicrobia bacterium]|nr:methyltransferase domain-containing protein [Elusimicrobiota bacterium]